MGTYTDTRSKNPLSILLLNEIQPTIIFVTPILKSPEALAPLVLVVALMLGQKLFNECLFFKVKFHKHVTALEHQLLYECV